MGKSLIKPAPSNDTSLKYLSKHVVSSFKLAQIDDAKLSF